jgi:hypothetical protein
MKIDLKNKTGTITLNSSHSLMIGNTPNTVDAEVFTFCASKAEHTKEQFETFGLFETATPNYATYYPDLDVNELVPKEEDFIYPIFRALSATVVWKGYRPIDFSKPGVLKKASKLLIGQTINIDHETALGNGIGVVKSVAWQDSYTADGILVPPGINAKFMIDGKSNPRIARAIQSEPPIVHSNSVSVKFTWSPSHKETNDNDFFNKLGTRDAKGELYRLVVDEIISFSETSLVSHGADPFAQIIKDGKINNPVYAASVYNFSTTDDSGKRVKTTHSIDYKTDLKLNAGDDAILNQLFKQNNNNNKESMEILKTLEGLFNLTEGSLTDENVSETLTAEIAKLKSSDDSTLVSTLTQKNKDLEAELTTAKAFEVKATAYETHLTSLREETKKSYTKLKGDAADNTILTLIENSDEAALASLKKDYDENLEAKHPMSCKKCGSQEVSRRLSNAEDDDDDEGNGGNEVALTNAQAKKAFQENQQANKRKK